LTLSVPAGSTSSASFYYTDTQAGHPVVTASASGYSNAAQTETVNAAALTRIALTPTSAQMRVGGRRAFSATGRDPYGNAVSVKPTWTVTPTLGTFSPNPGNPVTLTAKTVGSGTITASVGAVSGHASVTVTRNNGSRTLASPAAPRLTTPIRVPHAGRPQPVRPPTMLPALPGG
jgi:hypothetical protein